MRINIECFEKSPRISELFFVPKWVSIQLLGVISRSSVNLFGKVCGGFGRESGWFYVLFACVSVDQKWVKMGRRHRIGPYSLGGRGGGQNRLRSTVRIFIGLDCPVMRC